MDLLQVALIFLILLLSIFLAITGFQVFFILRDLKKALDKFNHFLQTDQNLADDIEKPVAVGGRAKIVKAEIKPKRFYKKLL